MAGIIGLRAEDMEQVDALKRARLEWPHGAPMVRPSVKAPVLVKKDGALESVNARFGFAYRFPSMNARIEKLQEIPLWKNKFGRDHCIVPLSYVIEWVEKGSERTPYLIQRADGKLWMAPALFGHHIEDKASAAFAICTREPNKFFGAFHDRMVGVATPELMERWLAPAEHSKAELLECIRAPPEDELVAVPTTPDITKRKMGDWGPLPAVGKPVTWKDVASQLPTSGS
jgi:putative SOS response-associated peptidase YedK